MCYPIHFGLAIFAVIASLSAAAVTTVAQHMQEYTGYEVRGGLPRWGTVKYRFEITDNR